MKRKTVLVTGASRGIGKSIAIKFAHEGYNVVITCLSNKELLLETKTIIESKGVSCLHFVGDMGDHQLVKELFELIKDSFGSLDVLVNNAGLASIGMFTDLNPDDWNRIIKSNLTTVYNTCSLALPSMIHNKFGKIINISSVWGNVGASCEVAYSASKGGVNSFTKALAKELAPSNIQVNAIACGVINTDMNSILDQSDLESLVNEIPANRLGQAEEVAHLAYQLTENNEYLTGQIISLDGGWV
ncbi:MAG TPA: SDR family NAD(P)-dependent oxidoreductase [Clostridiales bacterium]|nr:SDR family NAD(P)-dependent oxidoreductase [Clostridiales bacterium]